MRPREERHCKTCGKYMGSCTRLYCNSKCREKFYNDLKSKNGFFKHFARIKTLKNKIFEINYILDTLGE